ncbi:hypothetical protein FJ656_24975 [Schumannella luteola]|nr:hypothetical protein FJ656_24975 [Schumannella luteola]
MRVSHPEPRRVLGWPVRTVVITAAIAVVVLVVAIVAARWWRGTAVGTDFLAAYPGEVPPAAGTPIGFPAWLNWSHALNSFFLLFIVASGLRIRSKQRPPAFFTRDPERFPNLKGKPTRLSIHTWWHLVVDSLFVLNGVVFVVLLFATGQWMRIVPLSWDVLPNAVSAGVQYLSLEWPVHHGWTNYNGLQQLSYFATVFLAAPLALLTGLRLSPGWPASWKRPSGFLGDLFARRVHALVLWYFVVFTIVHVGLVLTTGALRNLNTMYAARDATDAVGLIVFVVSLLLAVGAWFLFGPGRVIALAKRAGNVREMPAPKKP